MSLFELIPSAYAQTTSGAAGGASTADTLTQFFPFILIIGIFYVLMIRPQQQKQKALQKQLSELRRGDNVVTSGGIIGTVARVVSDDEVSVEIAEGVRVRVVRSTITGLTSKGEPRTDAKSASDADNPDAPAKASTAATRTTRRGKPANASKPQA